MAETSFWEVAILGAFVSYFTGHQTSHGVYSEVDSSISLPFPVRLLYATYSWLSLVPLIAVIIYGFRVTWLSAVEIVIASLAIYGFLKIVEGWLGLNRNAWVIGYVGLLLVPLLIAAMFVIVFQAHLP